MGMYDYVNFVMPCPKCKELVTGFQSKDRQCEIDMLEPDEVDNFYSNCRSCHTWIEFSKEWVKALPRDKPLTVEEVEALGFVMTTR